MGLLSSKALRYMAIGAGTSALGYMRDAREKGEKGLEDLKIAKEEVNQELTTLQKTYDKALQVGGNVGGGSFANFLFGTKGIEYLANLDDVSVETVNNELSILKSQFDSLPEEERAKFQDYTKVAKTKFETKADVLKQGLQKNNNMGRETTNFLSKMLFEPPKDIMQEREQIISGVTTPELATPEVVPSGAESLRTQNLYTLPKRSNYENIIYLDLYEKDPVSQAYELKKDEQTTNVVNTAQEEINNMKNRGFDADLNVVQYLAEQNFMVDNPQYIPNWTFYQNDFKSNSNYANNFMEDFGQALADNDTAYAEDIIQLFSGSADLENQDKAKEMKIQLDNALKGIIDTETTATTVEDTTTDVPEGGLIQKGKVKTYGATDYVSAEEKLKNSQTPVTEEFIQQVMQKNNTNRDNAIRILKDIGYTQFPEEIKTSTVKGRIRGE